METPTEGTEETPNPEPAAAAPGAPGGAGGPEVPEDAPEDPSAGSPRQRSGWWTLPVAAASALGVALVLWRETRYGVGLTGRAVHLVSAARNYWDGEGFVGFATPEVPLGPPLYPLALTLFSPGWIDPLAVAGWLNALLFGVTVFVVGRYLNRRLESAFLRVWAPFALAAALPLIEMSRFALPGPLFLLLSALAMIRTEEYLARGRPASLAGAAVCAALACWTQYLGAAVLLGVVGAVLLLDRRASLPRRAFLGGVVAVALVPWAVSLPGSGAPAWFSRTEGPGGLLRIFWSWADTNFIPFAPGGWEVVALSAMAGAAFVVSARVRGQVKGKVGRPSRSAHSGVAPLFLGFALTCSAVAALVFRFGAARDAAEEGLLGPVYIALALTAAFGFDRFLRAEPTYEVARPDGAPPATGIAGALDRFDALSGPSLTVMTVLTLWVVGQAVPNAREIERLNAEAAGIRTGFPSTRQTRQSEVLRFLFHTPTPLRIYSNRPALVYLYTSGGRGFSPLPARGALEPTADGHLTPEVLSEWFRSAPEGAWVIWFPFAENNGDYGYGPPLLRETPGLEPLVDLPDGIILRVTRSHRPTDDRYRRTYDEIRSGSLGEPVARSVFDIYSDGNTFYYVKESCAPADVAAAFHLRPRPPEPGGPPGETTSDRFEDRAFRFADYGAVVDGACVAVAPGALHDFQEGITGQGAAAAAPSWSVAVHADDLKPPIYEPLYDRIVSGAAGEARARGPFDVYLDGTRILYFRESCAPEDLEARFYLHLYAEASVLPEERVQFGFSNADFWFVDQGWEFDGRCVARAVLPDYPVSHIRTGQYIIGGDALWRADIRMVE